MTSADFASPSRPRLRDLEVRAVTHEGEAFFHFHDREGVARDVALSQDFGPLLRLCDGRRTLAQITETYAQEGGETLPVAWLQNFVQQLDEALLLESPRSEAARREKLEAFLDSPSRAATLAGRAYPADAQTLHAELDAYFVAARQLKHMPQVSALASRGTRKSTVLDEQIRGCIVPHIDFRRGGVTEALAYEGLQNARFDTIVILGIAHAGVRYPFSLLPQDFETPLGTAFCDRDFCLHLQSGLDARLTAEPLAHRDEHSVEFVVVFAQHGDNLRGARIVPIVCGGFFQELADGTPPAENPDIASFARALRETCDEWKAQGKRVGIICSVDGAHVGSNFGDDTPLTPARLKQIEELDVEAWQCVEQGDRDALHAALARDNNARNVDAHPAVYVTLLAFPEWRAQLLHYDQAFSREENSVVSFAALTLYEP
jgi:AmmeMemoRadiSam system protein B